MRGNAFQFRLPVEILMLMVFFLIRFQLKTMFFKRFYFLCTLRGSSYFISPNGGMCVCVCNGNGNAAGVKYYLSIILFLMVSMHLLVGYLITDPTHQTILFHFFPIGISKCARIKSVLSFFVSLSIQLRY